MTLPIKTHEEIIRLWKETTLSAEEIAQQLSVGRSTIFRILSRRGLSRYRLEKKQEQNQEKKKIYTQITGRTAKPGRNGGWYNLVSNLNPEERSKIMERRRNRDAEAQRKIAAYEKYTGQPAPKHRGASFYNVIRKLRKQGLYFILSVSASVSASAQQITLSTSQITTTAANANSAIGTVKIVGVSPGQAKKYTLTLAGPDAAKFALSSSRSPSTLKIGPSNLPSGNYTIIINGKQ